MMPRENRASAFSDASARVAQRYKAIASSSIYLLREISRGGLPTLTLGKSLSERPS